MFLSMIVPVSRPCTRSDRRSPGCPLRRCDLTTAESATLVKGHKGRLRRIPPYIDTHTFQRIKRYIKMIVPASSPCTRSDRRSPGCPLRRCGKLITFVIGGLRAISVLPTQNPCCPQSRPTSPLRSRNKLNSCRAEWTSFVHSADAIDYGGVRK